MTADVVILGAGVAGSALAYALSEADVDVTLVERHLETAATGRSAGILTVQLWNELDVALAQATQTLATSLLGDGPQGFLRVGFLRATQLEEDLPAMARRVEEYRAWGCQAEVLDQSDLETRFPLLETADLVGGVYTPGDGYVDPYELASTLLSQARSRGRVQLRTAAARGLRSQGGSLKGVETSQGFIPAERVVVALGAWSPGWLRTQGLSLPLKPYRTQALLSRPVDLPEVPMFHELPEGCYFRPDQEGLLLGDGTEEREADPDRYNSQADFRLQAEIAEWISRRIPRLTGLELARGWAGVCGATPDRFPLVGPISEVEGLYVLAGFNGLGIMRSPPLAEALAAHLVGRKPAVDLRPLRPSRFGEEEFPIREGFTLRNNEEGA